MQPIKYLVKVLYYWMKRKIKIETHAKKILSCGTDLIWRNSLSSIYYDIGFDNNPYIRVPC